MEVVAGARYAFPTNPGFRILWLRVKRHADPEEGVPFSNPIFYLPATQCKFASDIAADPKLHAAAVHRLVVAHDTAQNRAQRLNKLLDGGVLNDKAGIIMDVHDKCVASRDIIQSRLPWAIVNAERPIERLADDHNGGKHPKRRVDRGDQPSEAQLLSMLLEAKEALNDVLRRHEAETATPEAAFPSPPSSPDHRPSRAELSHLPASAQPSRSGDSAAAPAPEPPIPPPAPIHRLQRFPSSATARFEHASPPPYSLLEDGHSQESTVQASASHVDIGSALPPSILSYLTDRRVPREVFYDVELALEGENTRAWLPGLVDIPQLSGTDCKAIALLNRRAMAGLQGH